MLYMKLLACFFFFCVGFERTVCGYFKTVDLVVDFRQCDGKG